MPGPSGFMKISAVVPRSRPVDPVSSLPSRGAISPVTRAPERVPVSALANVTKLAAAVTDLQHALADLRAQAREIPGASPMFEPRAVSPTANHWRAGYAAALGGLDEFPPADLLQRKQRGDITVRPALVSWHEGWQSGFKTLCQRGRCASVAEAHKRCTLVSKRHNWLTYRTWPAGVTINGRRPELIADQVRHMSQAAIMNYKANRCVEVPIIP